MSGGDPRLVQHAGLMDVGAISISFGAFLDQLPRAAALLSCLWLGIQMYESKTGVALRHRVRNFLMRRGPF